MKTNFKYSLKRITLYSRFAIHSNCDKKKNLVSQFGFLTQNKLFLEKKKM